jgi:tRNA dimethylallyltransferase
VTSDERNSDQQHRLLPLVAILGPTASGKTALSISIARKFKGEILACDSTQIYRGFDIGTAKPTFEQRSEIPHHLLDIIDPAEVFTAGEYRRRALYVLKDLKDRSRLPVFTVGTGLYLRALLEGLVDAPERSAELRERLGSSAQRHGHLHLHRMLRRLDTASAGRISANDTQKLIRALEICLLSGKPLSAVHESGREPLQGYHVIRIGLNPDRHKLHERIAQRTQMMLDTDWLAEVSGLMKAGAPPSAKPFEFIGYRELRDHLLGCKTLAESKQLIITATRQYAKRQMTWFRKDKNVHWFEGFGDDPKISTEIVGLLQCEIQRNAGDQPPTKPRTNRV